MLFRKCDKCGVLLPSDLFKVNHFTESLSDYNFDLCDKCAEKLKHWLNGECKCQEQ